MINIRYIIILISLFFFIPGCAKDHFIIYSINGEVEQERRNKNTRIMNYEVKLYFDRNKIEKKYKEINIVATDNFYYGQFFFDDVFMNILKRKVRLIRGDAILFEKDRKDFTDYDEDYLYFTVIKYLD